MPIEPESISHIYINGENHPIDAVTLNGETEVDIPKSGLVTSIDSSSDDTHYPSAKCMYDIIGDI
jgi:hypothetical protein